ncbi:MAG: hypothetical protein ACOCVZ_07180, partial [Gemmatimonadota bacterium]
MTAIFSHPAVMVLALLLAAALGAVIGYMLRGWHDEARADAAPGAAERGSRVAPGERGAGVSGLDSWRGWGAG